jgi:hypothetical protein
MSLLRSPFVIRNRVLGSSQPYGWDASSRDLAYDIQFAKTLLQPRINSAEQVSTLAMEEKSPVFPSASVGSGSNAVVVPPVGLCTPSQRISKRSLDVTIALAALVLLSPLLLIITILIWGGTVRTLFSGRLVPAAMGRPSEFISSGRCACSRMDLSFSKLRETTRA